MSSNQTFDQARLAVDSGQWAVALQFVAEGSKEHPSPDWLELRAMALYGDGQFEASVASWEELHRQSLTSGDDEEAARAASMIAMYLMMDTGLMTPVRGWLARATRLLAAHPDSPVHAIVAMVRTYERFMCGDMEESAVQATIAIELGTERGVQPAVVIGRVASARLKIFAGLVEEGISLLNEIGAMLMSGDVDPLTTGMMYCELICAAQGLARYDMANEWTEVMDRWRQGAAFGGINGRCRVHRAEMLRLSGPCDEAEEEALQACDELRPWMRREFGWPLTELGNIRLRRGDLEGAEEAFMAAHEHAWSPQPGLSLLRLAQGDADAAAALIADAIAYPVNVPSKERPPSGELRLAPLLQAQAEISAAIGDGTTCEAAANALQNIADNYQSPALAASAALAWARTSVLRGHLPEAARKATEAVELWTDIGAPYETADSRIVLGEAHHLAGNHRLAEMERKAAVAGFRSFGAHRRSDETALLLSVASTERPRAIVQQAAIFRAEGELRSVCYAGRTETVRDLKGLRYIERLLAEPNREFHVLDLVAVEQGTLPTTPSKSRHERAGFGQGGDGLPALDDEARNAYQQRLREIDSDIEDATERNDLGRIVLAQRDRDFLIAELSRAVGLSGRYRSIGGDSERARTAVARSIRYALGRLAPAHPLIASHLVQSINTGTYCCYVPDPLTPIAWAI